MVIIGPCSADNEEAVLENGLEGYADYKKKVKYKVIPYVW